MEPIPFLRPTFPDPDAVARAYAKIVQSGIYANGGAAEQEFRAALAGWLSAEAVNVAVVASGTAALQLAITATFLPDRRLVLVPSFTHAAGPLMVTASGREPVFVDIGPSWQPSLGSASTFLATRARDTAGILLTNSFGTANPEIGDWEALAARHQLPLVIDSAAGFGSTYEDGEPLGLRGTCEVFSFHATKTVAVGEGGGVVSRQTALIAEIERLKNFGYDESRRCVDPSGTNAKLPELSSSIGVLQLARLSERLERRRAVQRTYEELLSPLGMTFQRLAVRSALPFVSALLPSPAARDAAAAALSSAQVGCRDYYNPVIHRHPLFREFTAATNLSTTEEVASRMLSLPMADDLGPAEVGFIADRIEHALARH